MKKNVPTEHAQTAQKAANAAHKDRSGAITYTPRMKPVASGKGNKR